MSDLVPVLAPPATKPVASVARVTDAWYVACEAKQLKGKPIQRTVLGIPMVLFRTKRGAPGSRSTRPAPPRNRYTSSPGRHALADAR